MTSDNSKPAADEQLLSLDELRDLWNAQADAANSWDALGADEIVWWAQRQALARRGHQPAPPDEGEVGVLLRELRDAAFDLNGSDPAKLMLTRAAELLAQRHPAPVPAGMIPVEYWDMDSGARIVTEPSEEGPGGCWVVLNSRYVNPFTEFPTAKAAWDALQQAHALPLPAGEAK